MANFDITIFEIEDYSYSVVTAAMKVALDALDSTNNPTILAQIIIHPKNGKFVGVLLND